jgi:hypothetical protein
MDLMRRTIVFSGAAVLGGCAALPKIGAPPFFGPEPLIKRPTTKDIVDIVKQEGVVEGGITRLSQLDGRTVVSVELIDREFSSLMGHDAAYVEISIHDENGVRRIRDYGMNGFGFDDQIYINMALLNPVDGLNDWDDGMRYIGGFHWRERMKAKRGYEQVVRDAYTMLVG